MRKTFGTILKDHNDVGPGLICSVLCWPLLFWLPTVRPSEELAG
jgi:hypothetical protein